MPKFGTKNAILGYFSPKMLYFGIVEQEFKKKLFSYLKSASLNLSIGKISQKKKKMPKYGTKNTLFGYFWGRILKRLLSFSKSAPSNASNCKILEK